MQVLAVSDEIDDSVWRDPAVAGASLIVSCGDLPFDYLAELMATLDIPLVFVPGNHDPDVSGYRLTRAGLATRAGLPDEPPWPAGAINADRQIVTVAGLTIAGLGGCRRYRSGPNQYTERQFARRVRRVRLAQRVRRLRGAGPVDLVLTHAPPRGMGDGADAPHLGFGSLHPLLATWRPGHLFHGHVHPYGQATGQQLVGHTQIRNVVGAHLIDLDLDASSERADARHGT